MLKSFLVVIGWIILWQMFVWITGLPNYILPSPIDVMISFSYVPKLILSEAIITIIESVVGFFSGVLLGSCMAIMMVFIQPLRVWMWPMILVSQALPTFAIAPIIVIWAGYGVISKVIVSVIMIFFPVVSCFYYGLSQTPSYYMDLGQVMRSTKWNLLWHLKIPAARAQWASGIRTAAAFAPMGSIVGEWMGSSHGLGFLMLDANAQLDIPRTFTCLAILVIFTLLFFLLIDNLLKKVWGV